MDDVFNQLFTVANLIFCLIVAVLVEIQRRVVEKLWKNAKTNKWWNELFLPLGPLGTGGLLAGLIAQYPYPENFSSFWPRVFFGVVCGLASAHVYRIAKKLLKKKEPEDIEASADSL